MQEQLKMDKLAIDHMFLIAKDEDYIVIDFSNKSISNQKRVLVYSYIGNNLRLMDKGKKRDYMLNIEYIQAITIQHRLFKGMSWSDGKDKVKAGA